MSTLTLTIRTGNAAFEDDAAGEVARLLRSLADRLEAGELTDGAGSYLRDVNGNRCGRFDITAGYAIGVPIEDTTERATLADGILAYRSVRMMNDWPHTLAFGDRLGPSELDDLARKIREHGDDL